MAASRCVRPGPVRGRHRVRRAIPLVVSALVVLLVATGVIVELRPSAFAADCSFYEFVGARGSGEGGNYDDPNERGMGTLVAEVYRGLAAKQPGRINPYGVHYSAVPVAGKDGVVNVAGAITRIGFLGRYTDSVREGTQDTLKHVRDVHKSCPSTRFILAGYSQGAQAVGDALEQFTPEERGLIAGTALFGDPTANASSWSYKGSDAQHHGALGVRDEWPEDSRGKVFSYCQPRDPICNLAKRVVTFGGATLYVRDVIWAHSIDPHFTYSSSGDAADAVRSLNARLERPPTTPRPPDTSTPLDLVFAIDTTGSMGGTIAQVKANVKSLVDTMARNSPSYRFALVEYRDAGDDFQARTVLGFTTDRAAFQNAADGLEADGGGDLPESVYAGVVQGLDLPWRSGARKVVMPIGDAPGKDPEPVTGFTRGSVAARAAALGATAPSSPTTPGASGTSPVSRFAGSSANAIRPAQAEEAPATEPGRVYPIATNDAPEVTEFMGGLAAATGGRMTVAPDPETFVPTLLNTVAQAATEPAEPAVAPTADAGGPYQAVARTPISLSAGASRTGTDPIVRYEWDLNGDGAPEQTGPDPVLETTFDDPGEVQVGVRVVTSSGLSSSASATVTVDPAPTAPQTPTALTATPSPGQVALSWARGAGGIPAWYTVTDGTGAVLERIAASRDGAPVVPWIDAALKDGSSVTYRVGAGNVAGDSAPSAPVTALVGAPATNRAPVAGPDTFGTDNATPLVVPAPGLLTNDTDPDPTDTLFAVIGSAPRSGTAEVRPDGSLTYTPRAGFLGTDTFTYTARDKAGLISTPATVTINVTAPIPGRQRLVLAGTGRPPVIATGPVSAGIFTVATGPLPATVTGSGTVAVVGGGTAKVTIDMRRAGRPWQGSVVIAGPSGTRTYSGTGVIAQAGRNTAITLNSGAQRVAVTIVDAPARR